MKLKLFFVSICCFYLFGSCKNEVAKSESSQKSDAASISENTDNNNKPQSPEEKAKAIDEAVKKIESLQLRKVISRYQNPNPNYYYDIADFHAFYDGEELVKLIDFVGEEGYNTALSYYFKDKKVFFSKTESSYMDAEYLVCKTYLEDEIIFRIINKEKGPQDENTDFSKTKELVLEDDALVKKQKIFKEDFKGSMDRFKASKIEK